MKTSRTSCFPVLLLMIIFAGFSSTTVQGQDLENKIFQISMHDVNMPNDEKADVLTFKDGKFDSKECRTYGFLPSVYHSSKEKGGITFKSESKSEKEGVMLWNGTVNGNSIQGDILWKKDGQKNISYKFTGKLMKKPS